MAVITLKAGSFPGQVREVTVVDGSTVADALTAAGVEDHTGVVTVDGSPAQLTAPAVSGTRVVLNRATKGNAEDGNPFEELAKDASKDAALALYRAARSKLVLLNRDLQKLEERIKTCQKAQDDVIRAFEDGTLDVDEAKLVDAINKA